jgi:hypothetical protein
VYKGVNTVMGLYFILVSIFLLRIFHVLYLFRKVKYLIISSMRIKHNLMISIFV